jgi:hypothetical protein
LEGTPMAPETRTPADVLRAMVAAFDSGDLGIVAEIVHPDYLDHQGLEGLRPITGADGFARVVETARGRLRRVVGDDRRPDRRR